MSKPAPTTYLIADLHLQDERPETTRLFVEFLDGPARQAGTLYILGDLFEAWVGDDAPGRLGRLVARHLKNLAESGTQILFICGNRDFLLSRDFCGQAGMTWLEEPRIVEQAGEPILLLHGDVLCTDDISYQNFRRKVRDPDWQQRILSRPVWWRRLLARLARLMSRRHTGTTEATIMDVNPQAVAEAFRTHDVRRMIHGHTHRRAIHDLQIDQRHCQRIVLGDWHETGSVVRLLDDEVAMLIVTRDDNQAVELRLQETAAPLA
ncbi:UDP-2,3-diacylglucosamine diphosphatase [Wenzhouxiangella sp. XN201]|nr:UDP-2,3-diacylglucosamine diphosphatase [Wenzhouxiangella sp. XN201]